MDSMSHIIRLYVNWFCYLLAGRSQQREANAFFTASQPRDRKTLCAGGQDKQKTEYVFCT